MACQRFQKGKREDWLAGEEDTCACVGVRACVGACVVGLEEEEEENKGRQFGAIVESFCCVL